MYTTLLKIFISLLTISLSLPSNHFLILFRLVCAQFIHFDICRWVRVDILMDEGDYSLNDVWHWGFWTPVLGLDQWQTNTASWVDMGVFELRLELYFWACFGVRRREGDSDWIETSLPGSSTTSRNPYYPEIVPFYSFGSTFDHLSPGELSDLL